MTLDTSNTALAERYDAIAYAGLPHRMTHPDRLATVATFLGMDASPPATCRVLEVGCNDGSNLIPMALGLPHAQFVGCDLSARAIATGRGIIAELGLTNVTLHERDLAAFDTADGRFDYVIAHGVYSWVPVSVRDALFSLVRQCLSDQGVMFVSFNTLPGCHVRQAVWEVLHQHVDGLADPRARLDEARKLADILGDASKAQHAADEALRAEFRAIAQRADSALFHDDLAVPNDPIYFRDFAAHAGRFGLAYLAEAEVHTMSGAGLSLPAREFLSTLDPLTREQYLDFVRLRRFRQSLLRRADAQVGPALDPRRLTRMYVSADPSLLRASAAGKLDDFVRGLDPIHGPQGPVPALLDALVRNAPAALAFAALQAIARDHVTSPPHDTPHRPLEAILTDAYVANIVDLHVHPPTFATTPGERPIASPLARLQARTQEEITTLLHTRVCLPDAYARRLLTMLDGTCRRDSLIGAMLAAPPFTERHVAAAFVEHALEQFAKLGLLSI